MTTAPADTVVSATTVTGTVAVTRIEIADALDTAFDLGAADRDELVEAARAAGARAQVLDLLAQLPDQHYSQLRQLWTDLPHVPVEL